MTETMPFRAILRAGRRAAALEAEDEFRAEQWRQVGAVLRSFPDRPVWLRRDWDRAMQAAADHPGAALRPPPARDAIGRGWDMALAAFAPGRDSAPRPIGVDHEGRMMTLRRPDRTSGVYPNDRLAASWDNALKPFANPGATHLFEEK